MFSRLNLIAFSLLFGWTPGPASALWMGDTAELGGRSSLQVLQFLHEDYPPYIYKKNGKVVGTVATLATEIAGRAGYVIKWRQTAYRRLVREVQLSSGPLCAAGYHQGHRDSYDVLASKPFGWFPGSALAIRTSDFHLFDKHGSISDIMNDASLRGAFLMGAKYIGVSEDVRSGRVERHILIGSTDVELGLLVARNRVHFAVINSDQTNYMIKNVDSASNLAVYRPSGMAPPRDVGFICSKTTDDEIWQRLNNAIEPLQPYDSWEWEIKKAAPK